jgi:hypothetical protein
MVTRLKHHPSFALRASRDRLENGPAQNAVANLLSRLEGSWTGRREADTVYRRLRVNFARR